MTRINRRRRGLVLATPTAAAAELPDLGGRTIGR